ncbi:uncharacterized protein LOC129243591 [Anastrepha obliqua]|uniref:uncharacterized protein LOC129243591 n=1 Tax=Anastrepha obliqua TaxID=95512 RepID=UPI00240A1E73|nr:uncharacterized protein LOC129243591 [Anastrepha obliqua]
MWRTFNILWLLVALLHPSNTYPARAYDGAETFANITKLIEKIRMERAIETLVVFDDDLEQGFCLDDATLRSLNTNISIILLRATNHCNRQGSDVNREMLVVRCVSEPFRPQFLAKMIDCLGVERQVRILFMWHAHYVKQSKRRRNELQQQRQKLFEYCARKKLLNIMGVYSDFESDGHFYTYTHFPNFHLKQQTLWQEPCFPVRVKDMQGAALRTLPDQNEPRSIVWRDHLGRTQIGGFMARIIKAFAAKQNATLIYPTTVEPDVTYEYAEIFKMLQNETLDVLMGLTGIGWMLNSSEVSTPLLPLFWTLMLPLPPLPPTRDIFLLIFISFLGIVMLLLLVIFSSLLTLEAVRGLRHRSCKRSFNLFLRTLTNVTLRSILGQATHLPISTTSLKRFICILLFIAGIYVNTISTAYLQTYLTSSPRAQRVNTFDELLHIPTRIRISLTEYTALKDFVGTEFVEKYKNVFLITSSINDYYQQRKTLDTHYGYTVTSSLWTALEEFQRDLGRPLFYINKNMHLAGNLQMGVPMGPHSIYREEFNTFIHNSISSGLMNHWQNWVYTDMVAAGKLNITLSTQTKQGHILTTEDLYWIWWLYGAGMGLAFLVCLAELYSKRKLDK